MADAFTTSTVLTNQIQTVYDRIAFFALRSEPVFSQLAMVKPGNVTSPGTPVKFTFWGDLSTATTALSETVDVDAVALSDSQVTVTPAEYGSAILVPIRVRTDTLLIGFDPDAANVVAWNMVDTIDELARTAVDGGSNEDWVGQASEAAITATDILTADEVRQKHAELVANKARPLGNSLYGMISHPHVTYDLKGETGDGAWIAPHQYVDTAAVYNNEVGTFAGFRFLETPRAKLNADGGDSNVDTYTNYAFGSEMLANAESIPPHTVLGPVTDKLKRFQPLGWHTYTGFDTLREASLRRFLCASSIGSN